MAEWRMVRPPYRPCTPLPPLAWGARRVPHLPHRSSGPGWLSSAAAGRPAPPPRRRTGPSRRIRRRGAPREAHACATQVGAAAQSHRSMERHAQLRNGTGTAVWRGAGRRRSRRLLQVHALRPADLGTCVSRSCKLISEHAHCTV